MHAETGVFTTALFTTARRTGRLAASVCCLMVIVALGVAASAARAAAPGSPLPGFGSGGVASAGADVRLLGAAFQSDGKLVAVGQRGIKSGATLVVTRFTAGGALDGSFKGGVVAGPAIASPAGTGSVGRGVAIQSDGKIVVVGDATDASATSPFGLVAERFNSNGSRDSSFGSGGVVRALTGSLSGNGYAVAIQPDGKILAVGSVATASGSSIVAVVRLTSSGALDPSFGSGGQALLSLGTDSVALAVARQPDGKIVIAGTQSPGLQVVNALIARLTPSGGLDPSFHGTGAFAHQYAQASANSTFNALAIQSNGGILAAGAATHGNSGADALLVRFTPAGAQDGSFGSGGAVYSTSAANATISGAVPGTTGLAIAGNGDIIAGGTVANSILTDVAVRAYKPNGAPDPGFGSAGVALRSFGSTVSGEANALAIGPDGRIAAAGGTRSFITAANSGVVAGYTGFAPAFVPPLKVSLVGVKGTDKTSAVLKHGLGVKVGCNEACSIRVSLGISAGTAKQLRILTFYRRCTKVHGKRHCAKAHAYRAVTLATGSATLGGAGTRTLTLRLSRALGNIVGKQKTVKVTLRVGVTSTATHKSITISKGLTFKR